MLTSGRTVPHGEVIRADVCVVGAGVAGIAIATELARAKLDVVVLERGGMPTEPQVEPSTVTNIGLRYRIERTRAFAIGGSVNRWDVETPLGGGMGRLRELDDVDFDRRSWIPHSGWPISKSDLTRWYPRARELFEVPTTPDTALDAQLESDPLVPALKTHAFVFANPGGFPGHYFRSLETHPLALVLTHSVASRLLTDGDDVSGLEVATDGPRFVVQARRYVLAAGALETARLLLNSRHSNGTAVGNRYDLVGRFFMEHPHYSAGILDPTDATLATDTKRHQIHLRDGTPFQSTYSLDERIAERAGLPRSTFILQPTTDSSQLRRLGYGTRTFEAIRHSAEVRGHVRNGGRPSPRDVARLALNAPHLARLGAGSATARLGRLFRIPRYVEPRLLKLYAMSEQIPNPASRVVLTDERDEFGVEKAALDWRLTDDDIAAYQRTIALVGDEFARANMGRVKSLLNRDSHLLPGLVGGPHHMGTVRMAADPRHGVVGANGSLHEAPNVFVAGSAVFPTVGYANPTLTVVALALRLAQHLVTDLQQT